MKGWKKSDFLQEPFFQLCGNQTINQRKRYLVKRKGQCLSPRTAPALFFYGAVLPFQRADTPGSNPSGSGLKTRREHLIF
jgi:hypothetical protein